MDEESKICISAIIADSRTRRSKPRSRSKSRVPFWETPKEEKTYIRAFSEDPMESTKDQIAILSVDQSKACIVLRAPMTAHMQSQIAARIPSNQGRYNRELGVWEFHPAVIDKLKLFLKEFYKDVQVLGVQKQIPATKFDQLMAKLDREDKDKIYRLLAMKYHPDRGGNREVMTLVNMVFKGG